MWLNFATLPTDAELASIRAVGYRLDATTLHVSTVHGNSYVITEGVNFWVADGRDQTAFKSIGATEQAGQPPTQPDPINPGQDIFCHKVISETDYATLQSEGAVKAGCHYVIVPDSCPL